MKEHIDFYKKREVLHNEIVDAIKDLMQSHNITEIDFRDYETDDAYICNATLAPAVEEVVAKVRLNDGLVEVMTTDSEDYDRWLDITDDCLLASGSMIYDVLYLILEKD